MQKSFNYVLRYSTLVIISLFSVSTYSQVGLVSFGKNIEFDVLYSSKIPIEVRSNEAGKFKGYKIASGKTETLIWKPYFNSRDAVKPLRFGMDTFNKIRSNASQLNTFSFTSEVSCGYEHTLFLVKGKVYGQGTCVDGREGDIGQCDARTFLELSNKTAIGISAGGLHSLILLDDGTIRAYGNNDKGQCTVPAAISKTNRAKAVVAGFFHSLVLMEDGTVLAFGDNSKGQCNVPAQITTSNPAIAISTKGYHNLVLLKSGKVLAFGDNQFGQCNISNYVSSQDSIVEVRAGLNHSALLNASGGIYLFGDNSSGQCDFTKDLLKNASVECFDAGYDETVLLLKDGTFVFLGKNEFGEGTPDYEFQNFKPGKVLDFACGQDYSAYVLEDGRLAIARENKLIYRNLSSNQQSKFKSIHGGFKNAAILYTDGGVELIYRKPMETDSLQNIPGYTPSLNPIVSVSVGYNHFYGIRKNGDLIAWGDNKYGQCDFQKHVPQNRFAKQVELGYYHTLILLDNDSLIAFGLDSIYDVDPKTGDIIRVYTGQAKVAEPSTKYKIIKAYEASNITVSKDNKIDFFGYGDEFYDPSSIQVSENIKDITLIINNEFSTDLLIIFESDTVSNIYDKVYNYKIKKIASRGYNALALVKEQCSVSYGLSITSNKLTVTPDTLDVRWLDCKTQYSHIYNKDFPVFYADKDGNFAVEVRSKYCIDTSECIELSGISNRVKTAEVSAVNIRIKQNPVINSLILENYPREAKYLIFNTFGVCVQQGLCKQEINVDALEPGTYMICINQSCLKFIK